MYSDRQRVNSYASLQTYFTKFAKVQLHNHSCRRETLRETLTRYRCVADSRQCAGCMPREKLYAIVYCIEKDTSIRISSEFIVLPEKFADAQSQLSPAPRPVMSRSHQPKQGNAERRQFPTSNRLKQTERTRFRQLESVRQSGAF